MYGGCGTNESTVSHCGLIHLNYVEVVHVRVSISVCGFVSGEETIRISMYV